MAALLDLPALRGHSIDPVALREAAGVPMLLSLTARNVREEPALADVPRVLDDPAAAATVGLALRRALADGVRLWVGESDARSEAAWEASPLAAARRGIEARPEPEAHDDAPGSDVPGSTARPIGVSPVALTRALLADGERGVELLRRHLDGLDTLRVPRDLSRELADAGIAVRPRGLLTRWSRDPQVIAYVIVFVYSALRALPVSLVKEFHGSLITLWAIDLITAFPYTWGIIAAVSGTRVRVRLAGLVVTTVTFVAPYVYFWLHGREYPPSVVVIVALLIVSGVALEVYKYVRTTRLSARLLAAARPIRPAGQAGHRSAPASSAAR